LAKILEIFDRTAEGIGAEHSLPAMDAEKPPGEVRLAALAPKVPPSPAEPIVPVAQESSSLCNFAKYFCAWLRTWAEVRLQQDNSRMWVRTGELKITTHEAVPCHS
jgi:hypothetical protein